MAVSLNAPATFLARAGSLLRCRSPVPRFCSAYEVAADFFPAASSASVTARPTDGLFLPQVGRRKISNQGGTRGRLQDLGWCRLGFGCSFRSIGAIRFGLR